MHMLPGTAQPTCFNCGAVLEVPSGPIGRNTTCDKCDSDVRVCLNCQHYDPSSYNECNEPMAERVVEKNRANFCDYFALGSPSTRGAATGAKDNALKALDDLFKKK